jgi:hypothetical protein
LEISDSSVAGIITALSASIGALATLATAFALLIPVLRNTREIHKIVNQQRTDMLRYQRALTKALIKEGIEVPEDQSIGPVE